MKHFLKCLVVLSFLTGGYAYSDTYKYTGTNFVSASGAYTTAMRVTGSITTSVPIPPNSVDLDITGILTGWTFFDGLQTISNVNGAINPNYPPLVSTDALGGIIATNLRFLTAPLGTAVGDKDDFIVTKSNNLVAIEAVCANLSGGFCSDWNPSDDFAVNKTSGVWEIVVEPPESIPSMATWSLLVMMVLLAGFGWLGLRRIDAASSV